jgi:hypothetical protein
MKTIQLSNNHKRSLSGSLFHLEKLLVEMEKLLKCPINQSMIKVESDLSYERTQMLEHALAEMKQGIAHVSKKYDLRPKTLELSKIYHANHTKIREILMDTRSKKMENYGAFPEEYKEEFDHDMDNLMTLANNLRAL